MTDPPGEKLREAIRRQDMSSEELAWVLGITLEALQLIGATMTIPTTALRLEAALGIPAAEWLPTVAPEDFRVVSDRMEAELVGIRRRRQMLERHRHSEGACEGHA